MHGTEPNLPTATPEEVHAAEGAYVLDVREASELEQARLDDATHIPLGELAARVAEVPRDRPVYVLCHVGGRSAQATAFLTQEGVDARNIDGGIVAWYRAGLPVTMGE
ncbi:rhodanese-like domain-containing protein [Agromyces aerolatus]|uniref:rhodanese-like domain-containing protein n=1 Tax=Agromyces sp. LY-1074 TaxID=3074080 RepID=UPI00285BC872|nr:MULTISPECIES: rhodanese-like domain-containing protein [unclassified Agromyces]MDR5699779.1 rhodanese-like domain-containing protein [Agromyces sp. LY-1074]MDR5706075.1 rhodanese-like domain-containing protein [Agromyces sp. LY-1358]